MSTIYDEPRVSTARVLPEAGWTPPPQPPPRPRRTHPGRLLAAAVAGLVLVGVAVETLPPGTPGHQLWTSVVRAAPLAASSGTTAAPHGHPHPAAIPAVTPHATAQHRPP